MSKAKGKKLVEILAVELKEWPKSVESIWQSSCDNELYFDGKHENTFPDWVCSDRGLDGIVTRAQWEAERAKLSKPKANAQGWIRNRGRSALCPFEPSQVIEVRDRDCDVYEVEASALRWHHNGTGGDIMAWRHISADQQAMEKAFDACVEKCASTEPGHVEMPAAKYFDGPLQWRDRITEIDAEEARLNTEHRNAIEALDEERVSLIQKLADEGFKLIERK